MLKDQGHKIIENSSIWGLITKNVLVDLGVGFYFEKVQEWWVTIYFSTQSAGDKVFWPRLWGDILITFFFRVTIYHNGGNLGVTINVTPTK